MMSIQKMKQYYEEKLWSIERIKNLVVKNFITNEDYKAITGKEYGE